MSDLCACCRKEANPTNRIGGAWTLTGFLGRFWGRWCSDCFHAISQTPNHEIINQELFNKHAVMYELNRSYNEI